TICVSILCSSPTLLQRLSLNSFCSFAPSKTSLPNLSRIFCLHRAPLRAIPYPGFLIGTPTHLVVVGPNGLDTQVETTVGSNLSGALTSASSPATRIVIVVGASNHAHRLV